MGNFQFSSTMGESEKKMAKDVLLQAGVASAKVHYDAQTAEFRFSASGTGPNRSTQDRCQVTIPRPLVEAAQWSDIRYLFRAYWNEGPAVNNLSGPNEWEAPWNLV